jgi:hypothetical protein
MVDPKYKWYLLDLGDLVKEQALRAKQRRDISPRGADRDLHTGAVLAYNSVISLMQQQALGFDIPLEELRLDDIDPDRDLI